MNVANDGIGMSKQKVPDKNTLARWAAESLTHQQMADRVYEQTGERVTRAAISMALQRHGLTNNYRHRWHEEIPWRVQVEHLRAYPVRMLRLLGRRRAGEPIAKDAEYRLDIWLRKVREENVVVAYDPDSDEGFVYVRRLPSDPADLPVRRQRVWLNPA